MVDSFSAMITKCFPFGNFPMISRSPSSAHCETLVVGKYNRYSDLPVRSVLFARASYQVTFHSSETASSSKSLRYRKCASKDLFWSPTSQRICFNSFTPFNSCWWEMAGFASTRLSFFTATPSKY
jgi:hypothetical protein